MKASVFLSIGFTLISVATFSNSVAQEPSFEKITLTEEFYSEGAAIGDIDNDGNPDIISGPFWYAGPEFRRKQRYVGGQSLSIKGYSQHFFTWTCDLNQDAFLDIITVGMPGEAAYWFENPGEDFDDITNYWTRRELLNEVSNESPAFQNIVGDEKPELICIRKGAYGYAELSFDKEKVSAKFVPITSNRNLGRFTHGMGVGDVNGDGRPDLLEKDGWWEQPATKDLFKFHPYRFAETGGAQMYAYDFDGDGDNDVVSSQNAHGYGLKWFEQIRNDNKIDFVAHKILTSDRSDSLIGLAISQMHAIELFDVDQDGIKDIVAGKRFWAHGGADPGAKELPILFWLKTIRSKDRVIFAPKLIDERSGVGTQIAKGDVNADGKTDLVIGSKLGTFLLRQTTAKSKVKNWTRVPLIAGSDKFQENVRTTNPLSPTDQQKTFVLPQGFKIELVSAEPDIAKPMNMAFDHKGRLWVSSSLEYPYAAKDPATALDSIKVLEDRDGDGRAEKVTTFADKLNIPMGLLPYGKGVICFSIPNIWYLKDNDGDGICDERQVLYGPFDTSRDTHGMCSSFTLGIDGWIYACHGYNNQSRVKGRDGHEVAMNSGSTFRFRPDGSRIEVVSRGQVNPFGMTIDNLGEIITADCHTKPINLIIQGGHHDSFGKPHDGLGYIPNVMEHLHDSTGIGGIALGENSNFPKVYRDSTFGGNVVTGRINRNTLLRTPTIAAREEADFLIPGDPWFRPVDLKFGPDGALYVADFYNAIIGHYEVDLDHPKRDRKRGRIWKIYFDDPTNRRDESDISRTFREQEDEVATLLSELGTANRIRSEAIIETLVQMSRTDQADHPSIVDRIRKDRIKQMKAYEPYNKSYWLMVFLNRVGKLNLVDLQALCSEGIDELRTLGYQLLGELDFPNDQHAQVKSLLERGLKDLSLHVRRHAAIAISKQHHIDCSESLAEALEMAEPKFKFYTHALKIAVREQIISDNKRFGTFSKAFSDKPDAFADICLAIKSKPAAKFVTDHIQTLTSNDPSKLETLIEFVAQFSSANSLDSIVKIARKKFDSNTAFQLKILSRIQSGLSQSGAAQNAGMVPQSVRDWATSLSQKLIDVKRNKGKFVLGGETLDWNFHESFSSDTPSNDKNIFVMSQRRTSIDGVKNTPLWSSIVRGESQTGVYRSEPFVLDDEFTFYIAGHVGFPNEPNNEKNFVQLRLSGTDKVLKRTFPPRNDTAHKIVWNTKPAKGKTAYIEIVDQDTAGAYAWLAAGRFSVNGLNPTDTKSDRIKAADLIEQFNLKVLQPEVDAILQNSRSKSLFNRFAKVSIHLQPGKFGSTAIFESLSDSISITNLNPADQQKVRGAFRNGDLELAKKLLTDSLKSAPSQLQTRIANQLASELSGAKFLLEMIESGVVSEKVLANQTLVAKMKAIDDAEMTKSLKRALNAMPKFDDSLFKIIAERKIAFQKDRGDVLSGKKVFEKNCANCHKLGSIGTQVGPNLDGIANRGVDRLLEDILTPNQNIDVNFRTSVVSTFSGKVYSGLIKKDDDSSAKHIVLINNEGKQFKIAKVNVEETEELRTSPMPANFHETISENDFNHLLKFLLTTPK